MAASCGRIAKRLLQIQGLKLSIANEAIWKYNRAAGGSVLRLQSNKSGATEQSKKTVKKDKPLPSTPSVPTDGSAYQVPEYYGHNEMTFYDLESDVLMHRQIQPDPSKPSK